MTVSSRRRAQGPAPGALTSDAWYTLFYVSPSERQALAERRRRIWSEPLLAVGLGRREALALLDRRDRWAREEEVGGRTPTVPEQLHRLESWVGRALPADGLPARLDRALLRAKVRLADGALDAVRSLSDAGVPMAIVSNVLNESGAAARQILDRLGLLTLFRAVVLSCEHPWAKPAPEPFALACRFLGVAPDRAVHIGDLDYDLRGATAAGMQAWWYVGLRRLNRYLPGQADPAAVPRERTISAWNEVARRFVGPSTAARQAGRGR